MKLNYSEITDVQVANIQNFDSPDFVDTFIETATYMGRDMTDEELDVLNQDSEFVYEAVQSFLY